MPPLLRLSGKQIIFLGFLMVLTGAILPWLMLEGVGILPRTFFLGFLTYALSLTGLILGVVGAAMLGLQRTKKDRDKDR